MTTQHGQEKIIESFDYNGVTVDLVEWTDTIWCGKIGYAANNTDEPDMDKIMEEYMSLHHASSTVSEPDWSVCISINYLTDERPNGVMIGSLVATEQQPSDFDIYKIRQDEKDLADKYSALKNIYDRIQLFYGKQYGMYIEGKTGKGTCIILKLPYRINIEQCGGD